MCFYIMKQLLRNLQTYTLYQHLSEMKTAGLNRTSNLYNNSVMYFLIINFLLTNLLMKEAHKDREKKLYIKAAQISNS